MKKTAYSIVSAPADRLQGLTIYLSFSALDLMKKTVIDNDLWRNKNKPN